MRRQLGSVFAALLAFALVATLAADDLRRSDTPRAVGIRAVEQPPEAVVADAEQPPPLREVKCRPGFGHGISYRLEGERHCFKELDPSPSQAPSPSAGPG